MPDEVGGEHADQHVALDAFFEAVEDGPQVQVVGLDVAEVALGVFEVLVGGQPFRPATSAAVRFVFYGRVSTEDYQDPARSRSGPGPRL